MIAAILTICGACIITCCSSNDNPSEQTAGYIPKAPDYSDPTMWITEDGNADGTPATQHDTITITVSPEYHVLVATNYSASEYPPFRGFLNVGDIHSCEPWLYSECLAKNIAVRAREWKKKH